MMVVLSLSVFIDKEKRFMNHGEVHTYLSKSESCLLDFGWPAVQLAWGSPNLKEHLLNAGILA